MLFRKQKSTGTITNDNQTYSLGFYGVPLISSRGFLPQDPLPLIPENSALAESLNMLVLWLPESLQAKQLSKDLHDLDITFLNEVLENKTHRSKKVALLILSMLAQGYIWENKDAPNNTIPNVIARNLYPLAVDRERFTTITYSDYVLHNWRLIDSQKPISIENVVPLFTFTGSKDEAWFIKIHVCIEAVCGKGLLAAATAHKLIYDLWKNPAALNQKMENEIINLLNTISASLEEAGSIMKQMKNGCGADYFFHTLRPYLGGWEKVKTKQDDKEIEGVTLSGIKTKDKTPLFNYRGPSGAQSSIVPALDEFLGIKHEIDGMYNTLLDFQKYKPKKHIAFINGLAESKLSKLVESCHRNNPFPSDQLKEAYNKAKEKLTTFRTLHMALVHQYIYQPAATLGIKKEEIAGTGGAPINEYLAGRLHSTSHRP